MASDYDFLKTAAKFAGKGALKTGKFGARNIGRLLVRIGEKKPKQIPQPQSRQIQPSPVQQNLEQKIEVPVHLNSDSAVPQQAMSNIDFDPDYQPKVHDLIRFKHLMPSDCVGEESICAGAGLLLPKRYAVLIIGKSGTNKSNIMDHYLGLLSNAMIYRFSTATEEGLKNHAQRISASNFFYPEELQIIARYADYIELTKNIAKGERFLNAKTIRGKPVTITIEGNATPISTYALENKINRRNYELTELRRVFCSFYTRIDKNINKEIIKAKAQKTRNNSKKQLMTPKEISNLTNQCLAIFYHPEIQAYDVFSESIADYIPIEEDIVGALIEHFYALVEAHTIFNYQRRVKFNDDGITKVVSNFSDFVNAYEILKKHFMMSLLTYDEDKEIQEESIDRFLKDVNPNMQKIFDEGIERMRDEHMELVEPSLINQIINKNQVIGYSFKNGQIEQYAVYNSSSITNTTQVYPLPTTSDSGKKEESSSDIEIIEPELLKIKL